MDGGREILPRAVGKTRENSSEKRENSSRKTAGKLVCHVPSFFTRICSARIHLAHLKLLLHAFAVQKLTLFLYYLFSVRKYEKCSKGTMKVDSCEFECVLMFEFKYFYIIFDLNSLSKKIGLKFD